MQACDLSPRFLPLLRSQFAAMQSLIGLAQFLEGRFEKGLVLDLLSCTQGGQAVQPHIDAHGGRFVPGKFIRQFHLETHKPPLRCLGDACACDLARKPKILGHIHPSQFRYPDAMITEVQLIIGQREAWLASFLALELCAFGTSFKKGGEGFSQIETGLIRGVLRDLPCPGELLTPDRVKLLLELQGRRFVACFIVPIPRELTPNSTRIVQFRLLWQSTRPALGWDASESYEP